MADYDLDTRNADISLEFAFDQEDDRDRFEAYMQKQDKQKIPTTKYKLDGVYFLHLHVWIAEVILLEAFIRLWSDEVTKFNGRYDGWS